VPAPVVSTRAMAGSTKRTFDCLLLADRCPNYAVTIRNREIFLSRSEMGENSTELAANRCGFVPNRASCGTIRVFPAQVSRRRTGKSGVSTERRKPFWNHRPSCLNRFHPFIGTASAPEPAHTRASSPAHSPSCGPSCAYRGCAFRNRYGSSHHRVSGSGIAQSDEYAYLALGTPSP
jgi:hypothetical protein